LGPIPNPQSPIPNPQSPSIYFIENLLNIYFKLTIHNLFNAYKLITYFKFFINHNI